MTAIIEVPLAYLFQNRKGYHAKSFFTTPAFADFKEQTIHVNSPDCGDTNSTLVVDYTADGSGKIPTLEWKAPEEYASEVKQWLIVVEDPDTPIMAPVCHSLLAGIPADKTRVGPEDLVIQDKSKFLLKGGFYYGKNLRGAVYVPPRPLMNHGIHRYYYQVVALKEPLDQKLLESRATREQVGEAIKGKILGWGLWVGSCERRW